MDESILGYIFVAAVAFLVGIFVTRWIFRIDYICDRLTAMSGNILKIKEELEKRSPTSSNTDVPGNV